MGVASTASRRATRRPDAPARRGPRTRAGPREPIDAGGRCASAWSPRSGSGTEEGTSPRARWRRRTPPKTRTAKGSRGGAWWCARASRPDEVTAVAISFGRETKRVTKRSRIDSRARTPREDASRPSPSFAAHARAPTSSQQVSSSQLARRRSLVRAWSPAPSSPPPPGASRTPRRNPPRGARAMPRAWASARVVAPVPSTPRGLARRRRPDLASRLRGAFPRPGSTPSLPRWRRPRARATPDDDAESAPGSADPAAADPAAAPAPPPARTPAGGPAPTPSPPPPSPPTAPSTTTRSAWTTRRDPSARFAPRPRGGRL